MTAKEKTTLLKQSGKLYTLGRKVEKCRDKLRRLAENKVPYDSPQMIAAYNDFEAADREWKRLERELLQYRSQFENRKDSP